ncbi:MAG: hypothetical protein ACR2QO_02380 [Acidimicrobiales bacterium]
MVASLILSVAEDAEQAVRLIAQPPVLLSVVGAVALLVAGRQRTKHGSAPPSSVAFAIPVAVAAVAAGVDPDRYLFVERRNSIWNDLGPALGLLVAVAFVLLVVMLAQVARFEGTRKELAVALAFSAIGIFLCVPETGLARVVVAPVVLVSVGSVLGWLQPPGPRTVVGIAGLAALIVAVDGQTRGSAIIGGSACLAAAGFVAALGWGRRRAKDDKGSLQWSVGASGSVLAIIAVVTAICSLIAGVDPSASFAAVVASVALVTGAAAISALVWLAGYSSDQGDRVRPSDRSS